jgi:ParB family chromosome partitioning protein
MLNSQTNSTSEFDEKQARRRSALIAIELIRNDPSQPRTKFDEAELLRLGNSMLSEGQLQDIVVRPDPETGGYILIAGERRKRAAQLVGIKELHSTVLESTMTDMEVFQHMVVENAVRQDLTPSEQGQAFKALMEAEGLNGKELAAKLNIHPSKVSRMLKLVGLSDSLQSQVDRGELPITEALADKPLKKRAKSAKRPVIFRCDKGVRITLQSSRKQLPREAIVAALQQALTHASSQLQLA